MGKGGIEKGKSGKGRRRVSLIRQRHAGRTYYQQETQHSDLDMDGLASGWGMEDLGYGGVFWLSFSCLII